MRLILISGFIFLLFFSQGYANSASQEPAEVTPEGLKKILPDRLSQIETKFSRLSGAIAITDEVDYSLVNEKTKARWKLAPDALIPQGPQLIGKFNATFSLTDRYSKADITSDMDGVAASIAGIERNKPAYRNVYCIGPRGSFTLVWLSRDSSSEVTSFAAKGEREKPRIHSIVRYAIDATYSLPLNKKLSELLGDDQFSIKKVERYTLDEHDCYRASFVYRQNYTRRENKENKSSEIEIEGNFVVDPTFDWALRSWEYATPEISRSNSMKISYSRVGNGHFVPSEVISTPDKSKRVTCRFEKVTSDPVDAKEFTLTYYGLPELDQPIGDVTGNSLAIWLGSAALLTLAVSAFLWFKGRHSSNSDQKA